MKTLIALLTVTASLAQAADRTRVACDLEGWDKNDRRLWTISIDMNNGGVDADGRWVTVFETSGYHLFIRQESATDGKTRLVRAFASFGMNGGAWAEKPLDPSGARVEILGLTSPAPGADYHLLYCAEVPAR